MKNSLKSIISIVVIILSLIVVFSTNWITKTFKIEGFETLLFTILMPTKGTSTELVLAGVLNCLIIPLLATTIVVIVFKVIKKIGNDTIVKIINFIFSKSLIISVVVFILSVLHFYNGLKVGEYINNQMNKSTIYEEYYVDPKTVNYTFPDEKRNLILICMESVEASLYSKEQGGALDENIIPELYDLANNNLTFTDKSNQGFMVAPNTSWTMGSNVGTQCGIPLGDMFVGNRTFDNKDDFLPGAYGLGDILKANGYTNVFMVGDEAEFASTDKFFKKHGDYEIFDYTYASENGWLPDGYRVYWGYEDQKLFEFAKKKLIELSSSGKPFNLMITTLDSHNPDGYECDQCVDYYGSQLFNAFRCSSKQVVNFVNWLKEQPYYENTTIVIMGDHVGMSEKLYDMIDDSIYQRKPYFAIINAPITPSITSHRTFCTYDLFPTILASLGIKYDSDRLALGTNLFSNSPTLMEELGDDFFREVRKSSDYYTNKIVLGK